MCINYYYAYTLSNDDVIIHFLIVKWTTLGLFVLKFMQKCRAQLHDDREAIVE